VKITSGVYLEILLRDLVLSCRLLPEGEEKGREQVVDRLKPLDLPLPTESLGDWSVSIPAL